jgi:hypothetical protein
MGKIVPRCLEGLLLIAILSAWQPGLYAQQPCSYYDIPNDITAGAVSAGAQVIDLAGSPSIPPCSNSPSKFQKDENGLCTR